MAFEFLHSRGETGEQRDVSESGGVVVHYDRDIGPFRGIEARPIDRNGDSYDSSIVRWK